MTVFRILSEYGYHTSYNRNAAFYALRDVPQFDPAGLWAYRGIRFSRHGSLSDTIVLVTIWEGTTFSARWAQAEICGFQ